MNFIVNKLPFYFLLLFTASLLNCTQENNTPDQIDYSQLPELELEKLFSIEESDDFLPAWIVRVMVTSDNHILVAHRNPSSIYQFDSDGNYLAKITGPGRGPGELSQYANPHFNGNLLIMSNNNQMFTEFKPNKNGLFEYTTDYLFRPPGVLRGLRSKNSFTSFYVKEDSAKAPFGTIPDEFTTDLIHLVEVEGDSLKVQRSVVSLQQHSPYIEIMDNGNSMRYFSLPYRYSDQFTPLDDKRILVTRPKTSSIIVLGEDFEPVRTLTLNIKPRPFTDEDLSYHFPNDSQSEKQKKMQLIKAIKPPFISVIMDNQDRFWLNTDETETGQEYVVLDKDGNPLGRFYLPSTSRIHQIKDNRIYVVGQINGGVPVINVFKHSL